MKRAYLDSSVWIARTEGLSIYQKIVKNNLLALEKDGWQFCLSDLVILEVLLKPQKQNQYKLIDTYKEAFSEVARLSTYETVFDNALLYAQKEGLKALDAIHIAFAVEYGCELFITTDTDFRHLQTIQVNWIDLSSSSL